MTIQVGILSNAFLAIEYERIQLCRNEENNKNKKKKVHSNLGNRCFSCTWDEVIKEVEEQT